MHPAVTDCLTCLSFPVVVGFWLKTENNQNGYATRASRSPLARRHCLFIILLFPKALPPRRSTDILACAGLLIPRAAYYMTHYRLSLLLYFGHAVRPTERRNKSDPSYCRLLHFSSASCRLQHCRPITLSSIKRCHFGEWVTDCSCCY